MSLTAEGEPESRVPTLGESIMEACLGTEGSAQQGFKMWPFFSKIVEIQQDQPRPN
jgi:hypothetical protein